MAFFLARKELDVIHQQEIHGTHILFEGIDLVVLDGFDHFIHKLERLNIIDFLIRIIPLHIVSDRHQKMGLSETGIAEDKQRVEILSRIHRACQRSRMALAVAVADHELFKRVFGIDRHRPELIIKFDDRIDCFGF